eukprot:3772977-Rhodomonas_salina.1
MSGNSELTKPKLSREEAGIEEEHCKLHHGASLMMMERLEKVIPLPVHLAFPPYPRPCLSPHIFVTQ